jgi:hypothetical protein
MRIRWRIKEIEIDFGQVATRQCCAKCTSDQPMQLLLHYHYFYSWFFYWMTYRQYYLVCTNCFTRHAVDKKMIKHLLDKRPV